MGQNTFLICVTNVFYRRTLFIIVKIATFRCPANQHSQTGPIWLDWPCWLTGYHESTAELGNVLLANRGHLRHKLFKRIMNFRPCDGTVTPVPITQSMMERRPKIP